MSISIYFDLEIEVPSWLIYKRSKAMKEMVIVFLFIYYSYVEGMY